MEQHTSFLSGFSKFTMFPISGEPLSIASSSFNQSRVVFRLVQRFHFSLLDRNDAVYANEKRWVMKRGIEWSHSI